MELIEDIERSLKDVCTSCNGVKKVPHLKPRWCWPCASTGLRSVQILDAHSDEFLALDKIARKKYQGEG